jgi:tetratricopeptide (TPR) repeat protein
MALTLVSMGVLALAPSSAVAQQRRQPADAGPTAEQRTAAREAYGRGQAAFQSGEYETAEAAFREAYEAVPNPIVLVSIAESQERLGNLPGSVETLERYLAERADAPDRARSRRRSPTSDPGLPRWSCRLRQRAPTSRSTARCRMT